MEIAACIGRHNYNVSIERIQILIYILLIRRYTNTDSRNLNADAVNPAALLNLLEWTTKL